MLNVQIERAGWIKPSLPESGISVVKIPFNLCENCSRLVPDEQIDAAECFGFPWIQHAHEELVEFMGAESAATASLIPLE